MLFKCQTSHAYEGLSDFCRMTLLLGPPGSGKTTLLLALAGKLGKANLKVRKSLFLCLGIPNFEFYCLVHNMSLYNLVWSLMNDISYRGELHTMEWRRMSLCQRGHQLMSVNMISTYQNWQWEKHWLLQLDVKVLDHVMVCLLKHLKFKVTHTHTQSGFDNFDLENLN